MAGKNDMSFAQQLAKDTMDGLMKQAAKETSDQMEQGGVALDPETQRKLVERELKMAADPDFAMQELAKETANERMRQRLQGTQAPVEPKPPEPDKAKVNQEIAETAKVMLERGIPAPVVAQFLMGAGMPAVPINLGGGNSGLTIPDFIQLLGVMNANKGSDELMRTLADMREEIKALKAERTAPVQPATPRSALAELKDTVAALVELGVVQRPGTEAVRIDGEPLEVVQEKNRHEEKMAEIKTERDHKQVLGDVLQSLPERIGEGLANRYLTEEQPVAAKAPAQKGPVQQEVYTCTNTTEDGETCNTKIPVPPGASVIQCPKCGKVYGKGG
jgi:hypothetical protein